MTGEPAGPNRIRETYAGSSYTDAMTFADAEKSGCFKTLRSIAGSGLTGEDQLDVI